MTARVRLTLPPVLREQEDFTFPLVCTCSPLLYFTELAAGGVGVRRAGLPDRVGPLDGRLGGLPGHHQELDSSQVTSPPPIH